MRLIFALALSTLLLGCGGKTLVGVDPTDDAATSTDVAGDSAAGDSGVPSNWTRCTGAGQCALVAKTCCGSCGAPTTADMAAVRKGNESVYRDLVCGPTPPPCPECAPYIADDSLQAWCVFGGGGGGGTPAGRCTAIDVRTERVSACATDADCVLRHSSCCEPCEERRDDLVALNPSSIEAYRGNVCVGDEACYRCASRYPVDARARCDSATRHCVVDWVDVAGGG